MKVRQGFVSNSSSSSFCILGLVMDERFKADDVKYDKWGNIDLQDVKLGHVHGIDEYYDMEFVGRSPDEMKDSETLAQFKEQIIADLAKIGVEADVSELQWYTDGGHD